MFPHPKFETSGDVKLQVTFSSARAKTNGSDCKGETRARKKERHTAAKNIHIYRNGHSLGALGGGGGETHITVLDIEVDNAHIDF